MNLNPKEALKSIKALLNIEVSLEIMQLENGTQIEAEKFESGYEVFIVNGEERVALPVGEYILTDGRVLVSVEEGIISEIKDATMPETEETPAEAETPALEAEKNTPKKVVESISKETFFSALEDLRKEFEAKLNALKPNNDAEVVKVEEKVVELKSEELKPEIHNPEIKAEKNVTLFSQNRQKTTKDIVFEKLFKN